MRLVMVSTNTSTASTEVLGTGTKIQMWYSPALLYGCNMVDIGSP